MSSGDIFFIRFAAAFFIIGLELIIFAAFAIICGSAPMAFMRASCSGVRSDICSSIAPTSSSLISFTRAFIAAISSAERLAPTVGDDMGMDVPDDVAGAPPFIERFAAVFRASSITSPSKNSWTSFQTRSKAARSARSLPCVPSAQHSSSSSWLRSSSRVPLRIEMGGRVANACRLTPPVGGLVIISAVRYIVSRTKGSSAAICVGSPCSLINSAAASICSGLKFSIALVAASTSFESIDDI
mmetsp:Transcript_15370/g.36657  ORF Transcript_15370/g.36657 Transcript_15370/m.36657 type:complete len:242 (-) Transcript_15370:493-1218(-)